MSKISTAIKELHDMDHSAGRAGWLHGLPALMKLVVTILYILILVSISPYDLTKVCYMSLYLIILFITGEISFGKCVKKIWPVFCMVMLVGIANPFLDRRYLFSIGTVAITTGMVSAVTLLLKGGFAVCASYLLMCTTSMEKICGALQKVHVPQSILVLLLLIYRYIMVLLKETERIMTAYELRAPGQRGIHMRTWGSLVGQFLLRSIDRAQTVYESMELRGFSGTFSQNEELSEGEKQKGILFLISFCILFGVIRFL